ncbi:MAG: hypothetical protein IT183_06190, partial [Acidobacteria bacterium]|nr:hypothetical protein [Acidobacteriota bacterium]
MAIRSWFNDPNEIGSSTGISDGDKGDITVSSSGEALAVDNGAITTAKIADANVTYAKIQNVSATDKVLGRSSSGAGVVEEIACTSSGRAMIGAATADAQTALLTAVVGDSGSGGTKGLVPAPGTGDAAAGKFLKASGVWDVPSGSGSGDVVGPASATDNAVVRFDTTTGKLVQNSVVTIADTTGNVAGVGNLTATSITVNGGTDAIQVAIRATAGQTADVFEVQTSAAGELFAVQAAGSTNIPTGQTYKINGTAHTHALGDLSDVGTATATNKHVPVGNGTTFESRQLASTDLSDTSVATGANDDFLQMKAGVWSNRTIAQVKTDLAASTTTAGVAELAIDTEVTTGSDATRAVTPDALAGSSIFGVKSIVAQLNGTTALTTSEKVYFRIPPSMNGMNLVSVRGACGTGAAGSSSSGTPTF